MKNKKLRKRGSKSLFEVALFRFLPYWPVFLAMAIIGAAAAALYLFITPPIYETVATILIKDEKKGVETQEVTESFNILTSKKIVENEIEVIKSRTLVSETVKTLNLDAPTFEAGTFSRSAYSTSPISIKLKNSRNVTEIERVDFLYEDSLKQVSVDQKLYPLDTWIQFQQNEIQFVRSAVELPADGPFYFSIIDQRKVVNSLLRKLNVQPSNKLSTIISISLRDENAQRGEDIVNTLIDKYAQAALAEKKDIANKSLDFIDERIQIVEEELDSIERKIEAYKSKRGIVDLSTQGKVFLQNVGENDQKLAEINMQLAALEGAEKYVVAKGATQKINPSTLGSKDERLPQLIQKLFDTEVQYERLRRTTAENNPILLSLQTEIDNMRPGIIENIRNQKNTLTATRANLINTNSKYASVLETIPQQERELLEANRQQAIKNNVFTFLLQKREESILLSASSNADSRLVDRAETSINPVAPKKLLVIAAALALSCILALAWIGIKEFLNRRILFRSEIEELTDVPVVAEVANVGSKDYLVQEGVKRAILHEQLRQVTASLGLFGEVRKRTILVTSAISGEGKSFISLHYALSLARSSKKVLLIDADVRNPKLTNLYNLAEQAGFSELIGAEVQPSDVIRKLPLTHLHFLPAGKSRSQAIDLFLSANIKSVFQKLHHAFDFVIIDTAPVGPVVDGYFITSYCDSTLFVVCHDKTPKQMLSILDENVRKMAIKNVSIIFNNVKRRGFAGEDFGYGYGYGRKYAYGSESPKRTSS